VQPQVLVRFAQFSTELGYDFVNVYDGASTAFARIASFSGHGREYTADILSSTEHLFIEFESDEFLAAAELSGEQGY
jgi:hypothetical protein